MLFQINLRTLVYSVSEPSSSLYEKSFQMDTFYVKLNDTMRIISGTLKSTPLPWLPYPSNISLHNLRQK